MLPTFSKLIRVFPRRTKWTPTDDLAFIGDPPLFLPEELPVKISVTFTWDIPEGQRLYRAWKQYYPDVEIGGPAFDDPGGEFVPGRFLKEGVTITSRGCIRKCNFCLVPKREGKIRELPIRDGWIVQDNNLLACSKLHIKTVFKMLGHQTKPIEFSGLDARILTADHVLMLKDIRIKKMWFAMDNWDWRPLARTANLIFDFPLSKKFCYVLIGFRDDTIEEAEERLRQVWELDFMPFAMLYQGPNGEGHKGREWRQFQRTWCRPAAYKTLMKK